MIPLAIPNISGKEAKYLLECLETNFVSSVGPFVTRLEEMTARSCGAATCAATSSGTTGLHAALMALGVGPGDLVLLASFTFIASANAVAHCHATPWFVDISADSWCLDHHCLAELLHCETQQKEGRCIHTASGRRVAAIMPVYTLGTPADMDPIQSLAREYGLPVIADAAAALGAYYKTRSLADLSDLTVISFNGNKTVTAGGGGAVVGNNVQLVNLVRHLTTTARVGDDYNHDRVGYNYRMTNIQAALGCAQMERLEEFVDAKRRTRARYDQAFSSLPGVDLFPSPTWAESSCWFSGFVLSDGSLPRAPEFCKAMRERGVDARPFWKPAHMQKPYKEAPCSGMTVTEATWDKVVTLPCSTQLSKVEQDQVIQTVYDVLDS